ncbi:hypothetical protein A3770_05p37840 [Chloropicon primus]|uniref:Sel1 repeat domain-containing protein n=1 Tax=Chloropicon primus TaxID=1764295 RepID=A0A5B8MLA5_9CHLO|nr:hypothetical protein A3770_05p37840 [Chloropicon primus]|eukprot:QDZ21266.1 hypothetical protein A3770_05p37840 [Chloropicon primus]
MNFSKAFGCGRITPSLEDGTAEETFMKGLEAVQRHGDNADWKSVAKYYLRAANEGLPEACCNLGVCYATGRGVPQSAEQAAHWYHIAAEKGLPRAQSNLAGCYASGRGIQQDWALAAMWFQKAAEAGDGAAACSLGAMHAEGKGVVHDGAAAAYWFHKAAKLGLHAAMFNLALCYEQGTGCDAHPVKAVYWYLRAARGSTSLANLSSERVAQLRQEFNVDVSQASEMELLDDDGDFALAVGRTVTNESRSSRNNNNNNNSSNFLESYWAEEQDPMQPSPQDCAISMERDQVCIDKLGRLRTKMSPLSEEEEEEAGGGRSKSNFSSWLLFSGMVLGFRKDVRRQRGRDAARPRS